MGYLEKKLQAIIMAQGWKFKTGNFLLLTSNTTPTPFTACAVYQATSNGTPTYANYTNYNVSNAYYIADGNVSTLADSWSFGSVACGLMGEIKWSKEIRINKIVVNYRHNLLSGKTVYVKVVGLDGSNNETQIGLYSYIYPLTINDTVITATITSTDSDTAYYGIRADSYNSEPTAGRSLHIQDVRVTEWYEKG